MNKKVVVAVAILGSGDFDVTDVDPSTLDFEGASPFHDLTDPITYADHLEDVNGDGFTDLVAHFNVQDITGLAPGDPIAYLTGYFNNGEFFWGVDDVKVK